MEISEGKSSIEIPDDRRGNDKEREYHPSTNDEWSFGEKLLAYTTVTTETKNPKIALLSAPTVLVCAG
jgi:hypothetical protein